MTKELLLPITRRKTSIMVSGIWYFSVFAAMWQYLRAVSTGKIEMKAVLDANDYQRRLMVHLFENPRYDNRVRPNANYREPVNVTFRFNLYQLVEVEERNQYVSLYAWVTQMWDDNSLKWDPLEYGNLTSIVVPHKLIWRPDTHLYNQIHMSIPASERHIGAILDVDSTMRPPTQASVIFRYPAIYRFVCNIDVQYFPFDVQYCRMVFSSWQYDASGIDFIPEREDIWREDYIDTGEWRVVSAKSRRHLEYYSCCQHPFSMLYIDLVMRRRPLHYVVNLVCPALVISAIANLGFFAPSSTNGERVAKLQLGMSTLFALSVILLMIAEEMPKSSSSVPLISQFFLGILLQTSSATVATGLILFVHNRGLRGLRVPPGARRLIFDIIGPKLRVHKRPGKQITPPNFELISPEANVAAGIIETMCVPLNLSRSPAASVRARSPMPEPIKVLQWQVEKLRISVLQKYADKMFYCYPESEAAQESEYLASVLDRICLIGSMITVCLLGVVFLTVGLITMSDRM